jgi:hypothetical protein
MELQGTEYIFHIGQVYSLYKLPKKKKKLSSIKIILHGT